MKIITFSNSYTALFLNPSLTTVTQPAYEMGREAAAVLFKLIQKKKPASPIENRVLNSVLIARNSTKSELARQEDLKRESICRLQSS